jgi:hypothetical protein
MGPAADLRNRSGNPRLPRFARFRSALVLKLAGYTCQRCLEARVTMSRPLETSGRPTALRNFDPSNFRAMSRRYPRRVSFRAWQRQQLRQEFYGRGACRSQPAWASEDQSAAIAAATARGGFGSQRMRYSFLSKSFWFTKPVTYASRRAHLLSFIASVHHRRANETNEFKFLDPTGFA